MPQFESLPYISRYNTLRLLGYDYRSVDQLCAITLVTDLRRPVFADVKLAKSVLASLLSDETLDDMRVRAFTLMPDHLHLLAGVRQPDLCLPRLIGEFKGFTTQLYWKRSREIVELGEVELPSRCVLKSDRTESRSLIAALIEGNATLRPEVIQLKNWPSVKPGNFLQKRLWQRGLFDHVIRNDKDLQENLDYIAMNPVRQGYVSQPCFYPYTGFLL
jgi:REP element-mobilizing transposase RayT